MDKRELTTGFVNASNIMQTVLQTLGMTVRKFSETCGVSYTRISDVVRGRTKKLTPALINTICDALPQVNKTYLYTGTGEVLEEGYVSKTQLASSQNAAINKKVNELMRLQQELLNQQKQVITLMTELHEKERELIKREEKLRYRELAAMEKENELRNQGKSA